MFDLTGKNALVTGASGALGAAIARALGEEQIALKLTAILHQEEDMARFLEQKLPGAVRTALSDAER